jgi:drug/metabolite transporter (DMT)-like permease
MVKNHSGRQIGIYLELAVVVLLWGLVPLVMKRSALEMPSGTFSLLRFILAALLLGSLYYRDIQQPGMRPAMLLMLLGVCTLLPFSYFFLVGVKYVDISTTGMIQGTIPSMTVLISALLVRSLPTRTALFSIGIAYGGLVLFFMVGQQSLHTNPQQGTGILCLIFAMACFSLYTILSKRVSTAIRNSVIIFYACIGAALGAIPVSMFEYHAAARLTITWAGIFGVAYMALFATAVSFILYTRAVRSIGPFAASSFTNFVPIVIILSGVIALSEKLNAVQFLAIGLVMTGVILSVRNERSVASVEVQIKHI